MDKTITLVTIVIFQPYNIIPKYNNMEIAFFLFNVRFSDTSCNMIASYPMVYNSCYQKISMLLVISLLKFN